MAVEREEALCPICGISEDIPSLDHDHIANFEEDRRIEEAFDRESERKMAEGYNGE